MLKEFKHNCRLMGNSFGITVLAEEECFAQSCIQKAVQEISRIETLLTTFKEDSQTNQVNAAAGINPVIVDREVFDLIERSISISRITDGAFDLSYGSIDKKLWNFDREMKELPGEDLARSMVRLIDYRNIELDRENSTVFLKETGMRIGFGGIGKGYAADSAARLLQDLGIEAGLVDASGDMKAWGSLPGNKPWTVGISHPDNPGLAFSRLSLQNNAIATSGNYEKFILINGKKYSHTINPKTGMPVTGIKSVTVIAPSAELADAMATPVTIMGVKAGISLIDQLPGLSCIIIDDNNKIYSSKNIRLQ
jgi:thiamine biosynthesis lipoprotein